MFYPNIIHEGFSPSELYLDKTSTAHFILTLWNAWNRHIVISHLAQVMSNSSYISPYKLVLIMCRFHAFSNVNIKWAVDVLYFYIIKLVIRNPTIKLSLSYITYYSYISPYKRVLLLKPRDFQKQNKFIWGNITIVRYIA